MNKKIPSVKIALDSDILRNLAYFCNASNRTHRLMNNQHVYHNLDDYYYLLNCYNNGLIEFRIGKVVYKEIKHLQDILDFIHQFKIKNIDAPEEQVKVMAEAYCNSYYDANRVKHNAPMHKKYVAADNEYKPSNDAYIMAEATIGSCYLLTNNSRDFIRYSDNPEEHLRVDGIKIINKQFKFCRLRGNKVFIPQPTTLSHLVKFLKNYTEVKFSNKQITTEEDEILEP